jgi:hypothetical protein
MAATQTELVESTAVPTKETVVSQSSTETAASILATPTETAAPMSDAKQGVNPWQYLLSVLSLITASTLLYKWIKPRLSH